MQRDLARKRAGFTLVEILVVIGLIAVLATILVTALKGAGTNAKIQATQATLTKLRGLLQQRIDAFNRFDFRNKSTQQYSPAGTSYKNLADAWTAAGSSDALAAVLVRKGYFRKYFPQTWLEATELLKEVGVTTPPTGGYPQESAEVLYFFLTNSGVLGYAPEGSDLVESKDTNNNGFLEFVDAWDQPLRFYRWPTRLIRPAGGTTSPTAAELAVAQALIPALPSDPTKINLDPDDPLGLTNGLSTSKYNFENLFHTPGTYHTPLLISAGLDGIMGLYEPNNSQPTATIFGNLAAPDTSNPTYQTNIYDDITTLNIRSGGK